MRFRIKLSFMAALAAALPALCMSLAMASAPSSPINVSVKLVSIDEAAASGEVLIEVVTYVCADVRLHLFGGD